MVRIRLRRVGGKKQASFRLVAADKESPRDGRFIEILGFYNPRTEPATIDLKEDRIYDWMSKGAQPSDSVVQIFQTIGLSDRYERFKSGEKLETLMAEALSAKEARMVNPKTRYPAPVGQPKKAKEKAETHAEKTDDTKGETVPEETPESVAEETPVKEVEDAKGEAPQEEAADAPADEASSEEAEKDEAPTEGESDQAEKADEEKED